jgi:uncharacterized damage-inducible protein DinB
MTNLLSCFFRYQAWANEAFFKKLATLDIALHTTEQHQAMRLLNHNYVVAQIFRGHLINRPHGYASDNTVETPELDELRESVAACDHWYIDYIANATSEQLLEKIAFAFTDGDKGSMTREEMLAHVITHGSYHRGEVGRLLSQSCFQIPWDTFAVFLHQADPGRRQHGSLEMTLSSF